MRTITVKLPEEAYRALVEHYTSLRGRRREQGAGTHPLAGDSERNAREWFKAAALVEGARRLDEEGPG